MAKRSRTVMWVKDHNGVEGNELADARAKREVEMGWRMHNYTGRHPASI